MKERELRKYSTCSLCRKPIGNSGLPLFWRVTVERFGVHVDRVQRQTGLAMMLGNAHLAMHMGPDEEMAQPLHEPIVLSVCETCAVERDLPVAARTGAGRQGSAGAGAGARAEATVTIKPCPPKERIENVKETT